MCLDEVFKWREGGVECVAWDTVAGLAFGNTIRTLVGSGACMGSVVSARLRLQQYADLQNLWNVATLCN